MKPDARHVDHKRVMKAKIWIEDRDKTMVRGKQRLSLLTTAIHFGIYRLLAFIQHFLKQHHNKIASYMKNAGNFASYFCHVAARVEKGREIETVSLGRTLSIELIRYDCVSQCDYHHPHPCRLRKSIASQLIIANFLWNMVKSQNASNNKQKFSATDDSLAFTLHNILLRSPAKAVSFCISLLLCSTKAIYW